MREKKSHKPASNAVTSGNSRINKAVSLFTSPVGKSESLILIGYCALTFILELSAYLAGGGIQHTCFQAVDGRIYPFRAGIHINHS